MALTFKQLVALLTPSSGALSITAQALDTPSATSLFAVAFKDGTLSLTGAETTPDEDKQEVAVTGDLTAGSCLNLAKARVGTAVFTLKTDGTVAVTLTVTVKDDGWLPSKSLPQLSRRILDSLTWETPEFTIDTEAPSVLPSDFRHSFGYPDDLPDVAEALVKGLSLKATVGFTEALSPTLAEFFDPKMSLQGPIEIFAQDSAVEPGTVILFPQLLLTPADSPGKTVEIGSYSFTFSFQAACLLQEFSAEEDGTTEIGVIATPVLALRTDFLPSQDIGAIPVNSWLYDSGAKQIGLEIGTPLSTRISESQLPQLLNGTALGDLLSPKTPGFPTITGLVLQDIALTAGVSPLSLQRIQVSAATDGDTSWTIIDGILTVKSLAFEVGVSNGGGGFEPNAAISCVAVLGSNAVTLEAWVSLPDLTFACQLVETATLDLKSIVGDLIGTAINLPTISSSAIQVKGAIGKSGTGWSLATSIKEEWVIFGTAESGLTLGDIDLALSKAADGTVTGSVFGTVILAGVVIQLSAEYKGKDEGWTFGGASAPDQKINLTALFESLARLFGIDMPDGLPEVDLDTLSISYDTKTGAFSVDATIAIPDASIDLTALPLVGSHIDPADRLALGDIAFHAGKDDKGVTITLDLTVTFGTEFKKTVSIPIATPPKKDGDDKPQAKRAVALPAASLPNGETPNPVPRGIPVVYPAEGSGSWIAIQKTFGPVSIEKVGFVLDGSGLTIEINAALAVSAVTIELLGLGLSIPFKAPYTPSFRIAGLNVSYVSSAVTIEGGLLRSQTAEALEFSGDLIVKTPTLSITALGSYMASDPPSMFAFVMADIPLGGPPVFFVTGLAGGFGFNRDLTLPSIDKVVDYPLVAGAVSGGGNPFGEKPTLQSALSVMNSYLGPKIGENWLAGGVRFTSFELLDSFALLTVAFGTRIQIGLIGLSTLSLPPRSSSPVVNAQLALEAVIDPEDGVLSVAAQLTSQSYVLAPSCHLTGGFAFYLWFGSNPHAGDFVITLGGYSPFFSVPDYYPVVPRLGINWKIDDAPLTITGGEYMALTPSVVMAGGSLKAVWKSGPIEAWFTAHADFLIQWKPFFYEIEIGVNFGVKATLELWLVTVTINVSIGASLSLYGPPFAGTAEIDLGVISFTIAFGDRPAQPKVDWTDFKKSFLLGQTASTDKTGVTGGAVSESAQIVTIAVDGGLLKQLDATAAPHLDAVVDPQHFSLRTQLKVPVQTASCNGQALSGGWTTDLAIGPMDLTHLVSALTVAVTRESKPYGRLRAEPVLAAAPKALWAVLKEKTDALTQPSLVDNCFVALSLTPTAADPDHSKPIDIASLLYDAQATEAAAWGADNAPTHDPWGGDDPIAKMTATIDDRTVDATRTGIVLDLIANGFGLQTGIDTSALTDPKALKLMAPPVLHRLGEIPVLRRLSETPATSNQGGN